MKKLAIRFFLCAVATLLVFGATAAFADDFNYKITIPVKASRLAPSIKYVYLICNFFTTTGQQVYTEDDSNLDNLCEISESRSCISNLKVSGHMDSEAASNIDWGKVVCNAVMRTENEDWNNPSPNSASQTYRIQPDGVTKVEKALF